MIVKSLLFFGLLFFGTNIRCLGQTDTQANSIELFAGLKYATLDYMGGPLLGLNYVFANHQSMITLRADFTMSVSTKPNSRSFYLDRFRTYSYVEYRHFLYEKLFLGSGVALIHRGNSFSSHSDLGKYYTAITSSLMYPFDWLMIELRGDFPLENDDIFFKGHAFPISISVILPIKASN